MMDRSKRLIVVPKGSLTTASKATNKASLAPIRPKQTTVGAAKPPIPFKVNIKSSKSNRANSGVFTAGVQLPTQAKSQKPAANKNAINQIKPPLPGIPNAAQGSLRKMAIAKNTAKRSGVVGAAPDKKSAVGIKGNTLKPSNSLTVGKSGFQKPGATQRPANIAQGDKGQIFAAPMEEILSEATRLKRISDWRERFMHMKFYFDGIDFAKAYKLKQMIVNLGGVVQRFLSFDITHFVTANPNAFDVSRNVDITGVDGPDVMHIAKDLEVSLWTVERLEHVLYCVSEPNALETALRNEKLFGVNQAKTSTFKALNQLYLLIDDPSGNYKPITVKEYPAAHDVNDPPYPIIRYQNHSRQTVFAPKSTTTPDEETSSWNDLDENAENQPPEQESQNVERNASGFLSGSIAQTAIRNLQDNPVLAKIAQRSAKNTNIKRVRNDDEEEAIEEAARAKRLKQYHVYPMIFQKGGFCENCNAKYDDYSRHIKSVKHRKYATNPANFYSLDFLFGKSRRVGKNEECNLDDEEIADEKNGLGAESVDNDSDDNSSDLLDDDTSSDSNAEKSCDCENCQSNVLNVDEKENQNELNSDIDDTGSDLSFSSDSEVLNIKGDIEPDHSAINEASIVANEKKETNSIIEVAVQAEAGKDIRPVPAMNQVSPNESLYEIERIIGKRHDKLFKGSLEYLVKWVGYSREESTWEPYANDTDWINDLHHIRTFEEFLLKNNGKIMSHLDAVQTAVFGRNDEDSSLTSVVDNDSDKEERNVVKSDINTALAYNPKSFVSLLAPVNQNTGSILQDSCADHPNPRSTTSRITPKAKTQSGKDLIKDFVTPAAASARRSSKRVSSERVVKYNS